MKEGDRVEVTRNIGNPLRGTFTGCRGRVVRIHRPAAHDWADWAEVVLDGETVEHNFPVAHLRLLTVVDDIAALERNQGPSERSSAK